MTVLTPGDSLRVGCDVFMMRLARKTVKMTCRTLGRPIATGILEIVEAWVSGLGSIQPFLVPLL